MAEPTMEPIELLTSRLRARLDEDAKRKPNKLAGFGWLEAAVLLVAVAGGAILLVRLGHRAPGPQEHATAAATATAREVPSPTTENAGRGTAPPSPKVNGAAPTAAGRPAPPAPTTTEKTATTERPSAPSGESAGSVDAAKLPASSAAPTSSADAARTTPSATSDAGSASPPRPAPGAPAAAAAKKAASAADLFGIAVGTYADENEANGARIAVSESTRLPSRVVAVNEDGTQAFRVVVGAYSTRAIAERAASELIRNGLVDEARVVPVTRNASAPQ